MRTAPKGQQSPTVETANIKRFSLSSLDSSSKRLLSQLMQSLQSVKTDTPEAKANETSMPDNNGKRIIYTLTKDIRNNVVELS